MIEIPKFTKHPVVPGVYCRVLTPAMQREEQRLEHEAEEEATLKASRRWLKLIPNLEWREIERIADRTWFGLGGEICDVHFKQEGTAEFNERRYAVLWLRLYVRYPAEDLPKGTELVSDAIDVTIYRDPRKPHVLRLAGGHTQFKPE
jgi:hypothetical protein